VRGIPRLPVPARASVELALSRRVEVHLVLAAAEHSDIALHHAADHHPEGGDDRHARRDEAAQLAAADGDAEMGKHLGQCCDERAGVSLRDRKWLRIIGADHLPSAFDRAGRGQEAARH